jgi:hypothetical protein
MPAGQMGKTKKPNPTPCFPTYGFATAAMLVPAIYEFDFAMGRTKLAGDE